MVYISIELLLTKYLMRLALTNHVPSHMGLTDYLPNLLSDEYTSTASSTNGMAAEHVDVVYECRHCGTTVSSRTSRCPSCDESDIAKYIIE